MAACVGGGSVVGWWMDVWLGGDWVHIWMDECVCSLGGMGLWVDVVCVEVYVDGCVRVGG